MSAVQGSKTYLCGAYQRMMPRSAASMCLIRDFRRHDYTSLSGTCCWVLSSRNFPNPLNHSEPADILLSSRESLVTDIVQT